MLETEQKAANAAHVDAALVRTAAAKQARLNFSNFVKMYGSQLSAVRQTCPSFFCDAVDAVVAALDQWKQLEDEHHG